MNSKKTPLVSVATPKTFQSLGLMFEEASEIRNAMYGLRGAPASWSITRDAGMSQISGDVTKYGLNVTGSAVDQEVWVVT